MSESHKNIGNKTTFSKLLIFVALLMFAGILGIIALSWGSSYLTCFSTPFPSLESVEKGAFFEFPDSANDVEYNANAESRKNGCTVWVKFEMDSQEIETFIESTLINNFEANPLDEGAFIYYLQEQGWHQPEGTLAGHNTTYVDDTYVYQWIFWEELESSKYTVYIITNKEWL